MRDARILAAADQRRDSSVGAASPESNDEIGPQRRVRTVAQSGQQSRRDRYFFAAGAGLRSGTEWQSPRPAPGSVLLSHDSPFSTVPGRHSPEWRHVHHHLREW